MTHPALVCAPGDTAQTRMVSGCRGIAGPSRRPVTPGLVTPRPPAVTDQLGHHLAWTPTDALASVAAWTCRTCEGTITFAQGRLWGRAAAADCATLLLTGSGR